MALSFSAHAALEKTAVYKWEDNTNRSWETVQEDAAGNINLDAHDTTIAREKERSHRAKKGRITQSIRRGIIRYMVIAIDSSSSAAENDSYYRPYASRMEASKASVSKFITEFYDQNPISNLGLIVTKDRIAERVTELSGNPRNHINKLQGNTLKMDGSASLQNTVILAIEMLKHIPEYGYKELLIVYSSLSTCDPGNIFQTAEEAVKAKLRISVISLCAEIYICKELAARTGGTYSVSTSSSHLSQLMQSHTTPPPNLVDNNLGQDGQEQEMLANGIYMGFPKRVFDRHATFCYSGKKPILSTTAYVCPRCLARSTDIPTTCMVCSLQLNSSSHIARSHHHLFPVQNFIEYSIVTKDIRKRKRTLLSLPPSVGQEGGKGEEGEDYGVNGGNGGNPSYVRVAVRASGGKSQGSSSSSSFSGDVEGEEEGEGDSDGNLEVEIDRCCGCLEPLVNSTSNGVKASGVGTGIGVGVGVGAGAGAGEKAKSAHKDKDGRLVLQCPECLNMFCVECDLFIHDSLHNCPGCC